MWSKTVSKQDQTLCRIGAAGIGIAAVFLLLRRWLPGLSEAPLWEIPCPFRLLTGLYCPGCGGQRAVRALLSGSLLQSFYYHPFVPLTAAYLILYLGSHAVNRISGGRTPALVFRTRQLILLLGVLILQWILKNILPYQI